MNILQLVRESDSIGMVQAHDELAGLYAFLYAVKPKNFLEIGTLHGGVFYGLTRLCYGKMLSVDLETPGVDIEWRNAQMRGWTNSAELHILSEDSHKIETFHKVQDILAGEKLGFLFIDGDHSYDGVREDYFMYSTFVQDGGWIAFHDINDSEYHRKADCFVARFWTELRGDKFTINAGQDRFGIGLIRKT
jgi:cephalosporin hydroxylase